MGHTRISDNEDDVGTGKTGTGSFTHPILLGGFNRLITGYLLTRTTASLPEAGFSQGTGRLVLK